MSASAVAGETAGPLRWGAWWRSRPVGLVFLVLFGVHSTLNPALLFPPLWQVQPIDYARYLWFGHQVAEGLLTGQLYLPGYYQYPLAALFYAGPAALFWESPDWLTLTGWTGRVLFNAGIWLAAYLVARQMPLQPYAAVGTAVLLFWSLVPYYMMSEAPYALLPILAGLALAQFLVFRRTGGLRTLALGSAIVGLASLARTDGFLIFGVYLASTALVVGLRFRERFRGAGARARLVAAVVAPWAVIVGAYFASYFLVYGTWDAGLRDLAKQSYRYFEAFDLEGSVAAMPQLVEQTRGRYGTPEENGYSVLRALWRNKPAALERVGRNAVAFPRMLAQAYGRGPGWVFVGLAVAGWLYLARRDRLLAVLLLLWCSYLALYLPFFVYEQWMGFPYVVVLALGGVGLAALGTYGATFLGRWGRLPRRFAAVAAGLLVVLAFVPRYALVPLRWTVPGASAEEQVAHRLATAFPRGTGVAAFENTVPYAARMRWVFLVDAVLENRSLDAGSLKAWLERSGASVVYAGPYLQGALPDVYHVVTTDARSFAEVFVLPEQDPERLAACRRQGVECVHRVFAVGR